jgi:hypothetical protein
MKQLAAHNERRRAAAERRRERTARPAMRTVGASMWNKETDERVDLERESVTTPSEVDVRVALAGVANDRAGTIAYYNRQGLEGEAAEAAADSLIEWMRQSAKDRPPDQVSWGHINALAEVNLGEACEAWLRVQEYAVDELESGRRAADVTGHASPLERARYLAVRDKIVDDWQPTGGVEWIMIEMLAQSFSLYLYWTQVSFWRANETVDSMKRDLARFEDRGWKSPYQGEADAIEQAHTMADRYNRMFLRVLRQMRDLRRYAPAVIVNNGGQVNLANQQVNVTNKGG